MILEIFTAIAILIFSFFIARRFTTTYTWEITSEETLIITPVNKPKKAPIIIDLPTAKFSINKVQREEILCYTNKNGYKEIPVESIKNGLELVTMIKDKYLTQANKLS